MAARAERTAVKPPSPRVWGDAESYFRVRLEGFREFKLKLQVEDVEADLADIILTDLMARPNGGGRAR